MLSTKSVAQAVPSAPRLSAESLPGRTLLPPGSRMISADETTLRLVPSPVRYSPASPKASLMTRQRPSRYYLHLSVSV